MPDAPVASAEDAFAGFGVARSIEFLKQVYGGIARRGIGVGTMASAAVGGVVVILLGISASSAVTAWLPTSTDVAGVVFARDARPATPAGPDGPQAQIPSARGEPEANIRGRCPECGVVAFIREIDDRGAGVDTGAARSATKGDHSEIPQQSIKRYEVNVRMRDGTSRVFVEASPAGWRPGERLILVEDASPSNH
ncbi:MAG: hypothetical protein WCE38_10730 [Burkholderiales bacterium]